MRLRIGFSFVALFLIYIPHIQFLTYIEIYINSCFRSVEKHLFFRWRKNFFSSSGNPAPFRSHFLVFGLILTQFTSNPVTRAKRYNVLPGSAPMDAIRYNVSLLLIPIIAIRY